MRCGIVPLARLRVQASPGSPGPGEVNALVRADSLALLQKQGRAPHEIKTIHPGTAPKGHIASQNQTLRSNPHSPRMILSPQQQRVLNALIPVVEIATDRSREDLAVMPRCHSLIIGPSGSGKSHVARRIADELGLPCLVINVATWVVIASRSEPWTWTTICEWLSGIEAGVLILDEVEKNSTGSSSDYGTYARMEQHDLLDGLVPVSAKIPEREDGGFPFDFEATGDRSGDRAILAKRLRERVMVIGCGTWQSAWRGNARHMGFSMELDAPAEPPSREQILASIDAELRQRFRDEILVLPPMGRGDYEATARSIIGKIPVEYRAEWRNHLAAAIRKGVEGTLGMRVFEELLLMAMVLTRKPQHPEKPGSKPIRELSL